MCPDSLPDNDDSWLRSNLALDHLHKVFEMALSTPPVGMAVFATASLATEIPMTTIYRGAIVFSMDVFIVIFLTALPQLVLFLPNLM